MDTYLNDIDGVIYCTIKTIQTIGILCSQYIRNKAVTFDGACTTLYKLISLMPLIPRILYIRLMLSRVPKHMVLITFNLTGILIWWWTHNNGPMTSPAANPSTHIHANNLIPTPERLLCNTSSHCTMKTTSNVRTNEQSKWMYFSFSFRNGTFLLLFKNSDTKQMLWIVLSPIYHPIVYFCIAWTVYDLEIKGPPPIKSLEEIVYKISIFLFLLSFKLKLRKPMTDFSHGKVQWISIKCENDVNGTNVQQNCYLIWSEDHKKCLFLNRPTNSKSSILCFENRFSVEYPSTIQWLWRRREPFHNLYAIHKNIKN